MQIPTICQAATGKRVDVPGVPQNCEVSGAVRRDDESGCRQPDGVDVAGPCRRWLQDPILEGRLKRNYIND
ncbi:hypothetical protein MesoLj131a_42870 [Mesorhizobium sp. 131-2-1]|nr:hypothetical protein MesoLj131a_42870 [Mesorhizobium sp. 131-2-1]